MSGRFSATTSKDIIDLVKSKPQIIFSTEFYLSRIPTDTKVQGPTVGPKSREYNMFSTYDAAVLGRFTEVAFNQLLNHHLGTSKGTPENVAQEALQYAEAMAVEYTRKCKEARDKADAEYQAQKLSRLASQPGSVLNEVAKAQQEAQAKKDKSKKKKG